MILVITVNSLVLALYDYSDRDAKTKWNYVIDDINFIFTAIFLLEASLRVIALGFIMDQESYLRNGWNIIDATVVVAG